MLENLCKKIFPLTCMLMLVMAVPVYAAEEDPNDAYIITKSIDANTTEALNKKQLIWQNTGEKIGKGFEALQQAIILVGTWRDNINQEVMPYYDEFKVLVNERVLSRFGAENVNVKLDEIMVQMMSGHKNVENASTSGEANPFAGTVAAADAKIYEILTTTFCNPDSANSSATCRRGATTAYSNENFIEMFLGERTWADKVIIDALLVARRFFAPAQTRDAFGAMKEENFIANRSDMTQANLRMSILNDLAARRAPTSMATNSALEFMFKILANASPFVMTTDASLACNRENLTYNNDDPDELKSIKFMNGYVCSFTSRPVASGERLISQAAIDRIMQHDFYLSADFYGTLNSNAFRDSSLDKMEVFMKAQQLAQDYRQLRLLQMKVAATAMNMMNEK